MEELVVETIDRLNNLIAAMTLPMPAEIHLKALKESLPEIRDGLKEAYLDAGGEDHWID